MVNLFNLRYAYFFSKFHVCIISMKNWFAMYVPLKYLFWKEIIKLTVCLYTKLYSVKKLKITNFFIIYDANSWDLLWDSFITPSTMLIIIRVKWKHSYLFDSFYLFAVPKLSANRPSLSGTHSCFKLQSHFESLAFWIHRWGNVTHWGLDTAPHGYQEAHPATGFAKHKPSFFLRPSQAEGWRGAGRCLWATRLLLHVFPGNCSPSEIPSHMQDWQV